MGSDLGTLFAFHTADGTIAWQFAPSTSSADWGLNDVVIANGIAYIGLGNGNIYGLNPYTGQTVWQYWGATWFRGAVGNNMLYVAGSDEAILRAF